MRGRSEVKLTEIAVETISQKIEARTLKDDRYHSEISTYLVDHDHRVSELVEEVKRTETNVETVSQKLEATALRDERLNNEMSTHLNTYNHRFSEFLDPIQKMVLFLMFLHVVHINGLLSPGTRTAESTADVTARSGGL